MFLNVANFANLALENFLPFASIGLAAKTCCKVAAELV